MRLPEALRRESRGCTIKDSEYLGQAIRDLYKIVDRLDDDCSEYPYRFLLNGNLLGSIGEVYVAVHYNLELFKFPIRSMMR